MTVSNPTAGGGAVSDGVVSNFPLLHNAAVGGSGVTANLLVGFRVLIPKKGTLHDLAMWCTTTDAAGHVILSVYDTGDALAGSYTKLWDSGSVATPATGAWAVIGDPALAVTAGQSVIFAFQGDSWTTQRYAFATNTLSEVAAGFFTPLPANFIPTPGGASPKLMWQRAPGSFAAPATVTEANAAAPSGPDTLFIIGRVA